jgi:hypothetical protein
MLSRFATLALIVVSTPVQAGLTTYSESAYSTNPHTLKANLGLQGYAIENFEGTELLPGLSVTFSGTFTGEQVFGPVTSGYVTGTTQGMWDGSVALINFPDGQYRRRTQFDLPAGVVGFGVGLSGYEAGGEDYRVLVNGAEAIASVAGLSDFGSGKLYLKFTADPGDTISRVTFEQIVTPGVIDAVGFDHLALLIPEPSSLLQAMVGIIWCGLVALRMFR